MKIETTTEQTPSAERYLGDVIKRSKIKPIQPNRTKVRKAEIAMRKRMTVFLKAKAPEVAASLGASLDLQKRGDVEITGRVRAALDAMDFSDWADELIDDLAEYLTAAAASGGSAALRSLGIATESVEAEMLLRAGDWSKYRAAEMVGMRWADGKLIPNPDARWQITESTREMISGQVEEALKEGWSTSRLADELAESHAFSEARAEMIARTEIAQADVAGAMSGYRASNLVKGNQWITAEDDKVSDECLACEAAGVIGLDEKFPGGNDAPPNHPNCRCAVIPILEDDERTQS